MRVLNTSVLREGLAYSKVIAVGQTSLGFSPQSSDVAIARLVRSCLEALLVYEVEMALVQAASLVIIGIFAGRLEVILLLNFSFHKRVVIFQAFMSPAN